MLFGANSTILNNNAPSYYFDDVINKNSCRVNRIKSKKLFYYKGKVNGKECVLKVNTGSDVSILGKGGFKEIF